MASPLVVELRDENGTPVAGETVVFKVTENNGSISDGTTSAKSLLAQTDFNGQAQVWLTLGTLSGAGNNVVEASSVGYGRMLFTAIADAGPPAKVSLDAGNNQTGAVSKALSMPFVTVVTDEGHKGCQLHSLLRTALGILTVSLA